MKCQKIVFFGEQKLKKKHQISGQIFVETAYSILEWGGVLARKLMFKQGKGGRKGDRENVLSNRGGEGRGDR